MKQREKLWTPGPWKVGKTGPNGCPPVGTEKGLMIFMGAHSINDPKQLDQAAANAQIISAAPDLVEALEDCLGLWGDLLPPGNSSAMKAFTKARTALTKAYGDSQ